MSSTPMAGSRRANPPTAISGPSASGTVTSWPDIRRPLKVAAPGSQPIVRANASVTSVSPMPVSRTKRASDPATRTGTVTRWCRYAKAVSARGRGLTGRAPP